MAVVKHDIHENDVVALREPVGQWPAGTEGTAVSIYDDAALVEVSDDETGEARDMFDVPAEQLEIRWRSTTPRRQRWKPDGSLSHRHRIFKRSAVLALFAYLRARTRTGLHRK
jgi:hypothetical protein